MNGIRLHDPRNHVLHIGTFVRSEIVFTGHFAVFGVLTVTLANEGWWEEFWSRFCLRKVNGGNSIKEFPCGFIEVVPFL